MKCGENRGVKQGAMAICYKNYMFVPAKRKTSGKP